jgi:hypothetical protein
VNKYAIYILLITCLKVNAQVIDSSQIVKIKDARAFIRYGKKINSLTISIEKLFVKDEVFWFGFSIRNRSGLSYPVDLLRLFIRDMTKTNRSSVQELEITPLFLDTVHLVPAKSDTKFLIAVSKFTIPDNKVCVLELFETNGGRNIFLEINNRQLFLAKPIPDNSKKSDLGKTNNRSKKHQYEKQSYRLLQLPVRDTTHRLIRKVPGHQQFPEY